MSRDKMKTLLRFYEQGFNYVCLCLQKIRPKEKDRDQVAASLACNVDIFIVASSDWTVGGHVTRLL